MALAVIGLVIIVVSFLVGALIDTLSNDGESGFGASLFMFGLFVGLFTIPAGIVDSISSSVSATQHVVPSDSYTQTDVFKSKGYTPEIVQACIAWETSMNNDSSQQVRQQKLDYYRSLLEEFHHGDKPAVEAQESVVDTVYVETVRTDTTYTYVPVVEYDTVYFADVDTVWKHDTTVIEVPVESKNGEGLILGILFSILGVLGLIYGLVSRYFTYSERMTKIKVEV